MSLKGKLSRLKTHMKVEKTKEPDIQKEEGKEEIPFLNSWADFGAKPFSFDGAYSIIREVSYPINHQHGHYVFSEFFDVIEQWQQFAGSHPLACRDNKADDFVFFDTETTGLGGGVGNVIFMIGYAKVLQDQVVVKQHFLPSPGAEIPFYHSFLTDVGNIDAMKLTSYNGKAFDWPQVKTRHTLIRNAIPKLPTFGHFDLLHASRRLWKDELDSVRLSVVENEILGIERKDDIPGYLAPMIYFDFLKDPNPEGIKGVFSHNEIDVLTLITLYIHLSKKLLVAHTLNENEKYAVAHWFDQLGQPQIAARYYHELAYNGGLTRKKALKQLGFIYKKQKQYDLAIEIWEKLFEDADFEDEIAFELSKIYEHRIKDPEKAYYYAREGYNRWKKMARFSRGNDQNIDHQKRIERLTSKLGR
jgi:uncharacterized protein YprB with RNaseH-like and TPR domain